MSRPRATIVIDNYNYARWFGNAIDSALEQTYPQVEVVVVDDGSTDESVSIASTYGEAITLISKPNGGQASAFNAGFEASHGDVIYLLDGDDMLEPNVVEATIDRFADQSVAKVHWPLNAVDEQGVRTGRLVPPFALPEGDLRDAVIRSGPASHAWPPTSGNAFSRAFIERVRPVPNVLPRGADTYLCQLAPFAGQIRLHPTPLSSYRVHGNNWFWQRIEDQISLSLAWTAATEAVAIGRFMAGDASHLHEWQRQSWWRRLHRVIDDIDGVVPLGAPLLLVDDEALGSGSIRGREVRPFPGRGGIRWGLPADDSGAIAELERERREGHRYMAVLWTSFWWKDHYPAFWRFMAGASRVLVDNDVVIVLDLNPE